MLSLPPLGVAVPSFWVGLLLLQQFSFHWTWFPAVGNEGWRSIVLPAVTLALPTGAQIAQLLAKSMQHTLHEPYIDTARSKGASRTRVHLRHALRNAALPALTMSGLLVGALLAGTVVTETVFSRTGLGRLTSASVAAQDIPVVQGLVLFGAAVFVVVNLVVDLLYPLLDPRIGHAGSRRRRTRQLAEAAHERARHRDGAADGAGRGARPRRRLGAGTGRRRERSTAGSRRAVAWRVLRRPGLVLAALWIVLVTIAAFFPSWLTSYGPLEVAPADRLQSPSWEHLFGTDQLGRDLFARTVYGAQLSMRSALLAVVVGLVVGGGLGLVAGFARGWLDDVVMRVVDVVLAIPSLLLSLALITVLGFGTTNVAIAVGIASVAACARIMRSEVLRVRESTFVEAAHANGVRWSGVLLRHVLPELDRSAASCSSRSSSAPPSSPSRRSASSATAPSRRRRSGARSWRPVATSCARRGG